MKNFLYTLLLVFIFPYSTLGQAISIKDARSRTLGTQVTIRGVITCGNELGTSRFLQDGTAAVGLFGTGITNLERGDSIEITGILGHFNNLLQLVNPLTITPIAKNISLPQPRVFSGNITPAFAKMYEGQLVRLDGITSVKNISSGNCGSTTTVFSAGGSGQNYCLNNNINTPVRILPSTDIAGKNVPSGNYSIIGIMSMFNRGSFSGGGTTSDPKYYDTLLSAGFQFIPRGFDDFILPPKPNILTDPLAVGIGYDSLALEFTTQYEGTTCIYYGTTPALGNALGDSTLSNTHRFTLKNLSPGTVYYVGVTSSNVFGTSASRIQPFITRSLSSGEIRIYFNRRIDTSAAHRTPGILLDKTSDDTVVAYINRAMESIDLAAYNINPTGLSDFIAALNNAKKRGVRVRLVGCESTANVGLNNLDPGIGIIQRPDLGGQSGIMHNKYMVIDVNKPADCWVWSGSTNLTPNQMLIDPNNMIFIQDQSLAKAYTIEFEEMFGSSGSSPNLAQAKFGSSKKDNTPHQFNINGHYVEQYFSPSDRTTQQITNTIRNAKKEIYTMVYTFTRTDIATVLRNASWAGIYGAGAMDDTTGTPASVNVYQILAAENAWGNRFRLHKISGAILHHKYMLKDPSYPSLDPAVLTGSHNWSNVADTDNDENTLIIHDAWSANQYYQNFKNEMAALGYDSLKLFADYITSAFQYSPWMHEEDVNKSIQFDAYFTASNATYNWDFGDGQTANGRTTSHTFSQPGLYTVTLIAQSGVQKDTVSKTFRIGGFTSVKLPADKNILHCFPIPAHESFTIHAQSQGQWEIYDQQGSKMQSGKMKGNSVQISTLSWPSGIYWIKWIDKEVSDVRSIMVQH